MRYLVIVLMFCGCTSIAALLGPSEEILPGEEKIIAEQWGICQDKLIGLGVKRAYSVSWTDFRWRSETYPFECGGVEAAGCYDTASKLIRWWREKPHVIAHECGHAILHVLGYDCHSCYEHDCGPCPKEE